MLSQLKLTTVYTAAPGEWPRAAHTGCNQNVVQKSHFSTDSTCYGRCAQAHSSFGAGQARKTQIAKSPQGGADAALEEGTGKCCFILKTQLI